MITTFTTDDGIFVEIEQISVTLIVTATRCHQSAKAFTIFGIEADPYTGAGRVLFDADRRNEVLGKALAEVRAYGRCSCSQALDTLSRLKEIDLSGPHRFVLIDRKDLVAAITWLESFVANQRSEFKPAQKEGPHFSSIPTY